MPAAIHMKLGIITDSHDDLDKIDRAFEIFRSEEVEEVVHLGDWCSPFSAFRLEGFKVRSVIGNNDGDRKNLSRVLAALGGEVLGKYGVLEAGHRIAAMHGEHQEVVDAFLWSGEYDVVLRGHTHVAEEQTYTVYDRNGSKKSVLLLNPGWAQVVVLDTDTLERSWHRILPSDREWKGLPRRG